MLREVMHGACAAVLLGLQSTDCPVVFTTARFRERSLPRMPSDIVRAMTDGPSVSTLGDVLRGARRAGFVGRSAQLELFRAALDGRDPSFSVMYVHGPGGIGKTSLLDTFGEIAVSAGATVVRLDGRDLTPSPVAVLEALGECVAVPAGDGPICNADAGSVVLLLDSYERLAPLDAWIRARLLPRLPATAITVLAGRSSPDVGWRSDPAWRDRLRVVSLRNLDSDESRAFLQAGGIAPDLHDQIVKATFGHPLGLSLLVDVVRQGGPATFDPLPPDLVENLLRCFVGTLPGGRNRRALEVCAVARTTTQALLGDVLDGDDGHELFSWLRGLSFIEAGRDGLFPHDLARDVLDADLRWRDLDGYQQVFRRVRAHSLARLRSTTGRAQQRAIFDLKFLFRHLRSILSPVEWESWGEYYPDRAGPEDRAALVGLVREWEGAESAAIAERWFECQPDGFFVVRGHDDTIRGMLAIVDLARAAADELAGDPGARAAWEFARHTAPPRPGEALTQCRFVIDREAYQGPSPTLNATPILTLQHQLSTPNLSWDFLTLAEPDPWDDYFAAADLPRAVGADFTVGGRRFGLFAHDFRAVPVDTWTELWTERALAQDASVVLVRRDHVPVVLSHPDFEAAVRQGLKDLRRPDLLARNPLLRTRLVADRCRAGRPHAVVLEELLHEAAATLDEHPRDNKLLRAVDRTYLRPAATQEGAAAALGLPFSTYRRHLTQGLSRIVSWLWDREVYGDSEPT